MSPATSKLYVVILVIVAAVTLLLAEKIASEAGVGLITACLGYVFGNGHGIIEGRKRQDDDTRAALRGEFR